MAGGHHHHEEIARASSALRVQVNMNELGCAYTILRYGTDAAKKKYIEKLVNADYMGSFGITEPRPARTSWRSSPPPRTRATTG